MRATWFRTSSPSRTGLGVQTMTRLILNDAATRELIGVPADAEFAHAEAVQAMVIWVDHAEADGADADIVPIGRGRPCAAAVRPPPGPALGGPAKPSMPQVERQALAERVTSYVSILVDRTRTASRPASPSARSARR